MALATSSNVSSTTLQVEANQIALQHNVSSTTLSNIILTESQWNPQAIGDNGLARGLAQIRSDYHPEVTDAQAFNPTFAMNWAAQVVASGQQGSQFTECSCVSYLRSIGVNLPSVGFNASDMAHAANSTPHVGAVAIFYYPKSGEYHVALITAITKTGFTVTEANYSPCKIDSRDVDLSNPIIASTIVGYWSPVLATAP